MKISYKSVYYLLESKYLRRSLDGFIKNNLDKNVYEAAELFAMFHEDYRFMSSFVEHRDINDADFAIFIDTTNSRVNPIVLCKDVDLTMLELALLQSKCSLIDSQHFLNLIEAQSVSQGLNVEEQMQEFKIAEDTLKLLFEGGFADGDVNSQEENN